MTDTFKFYSWFWRAVHLNFREEYFYMKKKKSNEIVPYFNEFIFVLLKS